MSPEDFGLEKYINFNNANSHEIEKYILNCEKIECSPNQIDIMTSNYIITIHYFAGRYICNIYDRTCYEGMIIKTSSIERFNIIGINSFHQLLERLYYTLSRLNRSEG